MGTPSRSKLKVGFLTSCPPDDGRQWSGTVSRMYQALGEQFETIVPLGPVNPGGWLPLAKLADKLSRKLRKRPFNYRFKMSMANSFAKAFSEKLENHPCDVLFAPAASTEIATLETDLPICYLSDTSFGQLTEYYDVFRSYSPKEIAEGNQIERLALQNAAAVIYPSAWAAEFVEKNYDIPREQIFEIPLGANIKAWPERDKVLKSPPMNPLRLLFLGVSWERKGGSLAIDTLEALLSMGIDAELTVCGCTPPLAHPKVKVIPFVDKGSDEGARKFESLMRESHFLLLPTQAEAFGVVFCEASAFAIPSIANNTGGVSSAVRHGRNGFLLEHGSSGQDYANVIADTIRDQDSYSELRKTTRDEFETQLNWSAWAKQTRRVLESFSKPA